MSVLRNINSEWLSYRIVWNVGYSPCLLTLDDPDNNTKGDIIVPSMIIVLRHNGYFVFEVLQTLDSSFLLRIHSDDVK